MFKSPPEKAVHGAALATGAALLRASAVQEAGNFDARLGYGEDADLGQRLLKAGYDVICDPKLQAVSIAHNTLPQVLERYWRWNTAPHGGMGGVDYLKQIAYSIKVMVREDLRERDPLAAMISLISPHHQFWMSSTTRADRQRPAKKR